MIVVKTPIRGVNYMFNNNNNNNNNSNVKEQHKSLGIVLTTCRYRRTRAILQQFSSTSMLMLSAIQPFC